MSITIRPELESRLRARAEAEGMTVEAYLEHLVRVDQDARDELETLALEGINAGPSLEPGSAYWETKHRQLDDRLKNTNQH